MAEELPQLDQYDPCAKAVEDIPPAKGDRGIVVAAKFILPETRTEPTLLPGVWTTPFFEVQLAVKKIEWKRHDAEESTRESDAWIIVPWKENGNVREFLQSGEWDIPERVSLIQDVACGLEYLHTRQPPICHGDLKPLNILVNTSYRAIITDFGAARIITSVATTKEENQLASPHQILVNVKEVNEAAELTPPEVEFDATTSDLPLTEPKYSLRWAAPEVLDNGVQDLPSDMWSLGWICWEVNRNWWIPFDNIEKETDITTSTMRDNLPRIREDAQLLRVPQLRSLISDCWVLEPAKRIVASTFCRKVCFVPSANPSGSPQVGWKVRPPALLLGLGRMYSLQNNTAIAEIYYGSALDVASRIEDEITEANALVGLGEVYKAQGRHFKAKKTFAKAYGIHSRIGNDLGAANALVGLGDICNAQSRYQHADNAFREAYQIYCGIGHDLGAANALLAHEIHSRIGNDLGTANALLGLGKSYNAGSRYQEAEGAFGEAQEIHVRIGNDLGVANVMMGLGESYNAQSRYQEAEGAFAKAREIYYRIFDDLGAANALMGLGEIFKAQSRYEDAEKVFGEAHEIHYSIGNHLGAANALMGLGEVRTAQLKYEAAQNAFKQAHRRYSHTGSQLGLARAGVLLCEAYNAHLNYSEADDAFEVASVILTRLENEISPQNASKHPEEDCDTQSIYSSDEETTEYHSRIKQNAEGANALQEDPASYPTVPVAGTQPNTARQEQDLSEQLTAIPHDPVPATKKLIDLLQALGKAAPKAVRHKHKIYSILRVSRDICNHVMEIGSPHEHQSDSNIEAILTWTEDYFALLDAIE
ncbi:hypothetical protein FRC00_001929, partial [Tulasnella sp. 408]